MKTVLSELVEYLASAPLGFVGFNAEKCRAAIEAIEKLQAPRDLFLGGLADSATNP
jgi:hypothetical protein